MSIATEDVCISMHGTQVHLQAAVLLHKLEHVSAGGVFHGDGQVGGSQEDLLELDDVRVAEVAVAYDLPLHMLCDLVAPLAVGAQGQE